MVSFLIFANGVAVWLAAMVLLGHRVVVRPKRNYFGDLDVKRPDALVIASCLVVANVVCLGAGDLLMTMVGW